MSNIGRREFLLTSCLTAGAAAIPSWISQAFGSGDPGTQDKPGK